MIQIRHHLFVSRSVAILAQSPRSLVVLHITSTTSTVSDQSLRPVHLPTLRSPTRKMSAVAANEVYASPFMGPCLFMEYGKDFTFRKFVPFERKPDDGMGEHVKRLLNSIIPWPNTFSEQHGFAKSLCRLRGGILRQRTGASTTTYMV